MAKAPQKSKEAKAKAAQGSSKKSKKKWSKGKSRDKLQNLCLFDKPTYDRLMKEVPKYKVNDLSWPFIIKISVLTSGQIGSFKLKNGHTNI